jgi:hypothetical protein
MDDVERALKRKSAIARVRVSELRRSGLFGSELFRQFDRHLAILGLAGSTSGFFSEDAVVF